MLKMNDQLQNGSMEHCIRYCILLASGIEPGKYSFTTLQMPNRSEHDNVSTIAKMDE